MKRMLLYIWMVTMTSSIFAQEINFAQDKSENIKVPPTQRKVNFGIKAGFNSSMFLVSEFKIKDVTIDEVQNNYKIGHFASLFLRINMKNHFIQPEISYNISKCEISFDKLGSQHPDIEPDYASVKSSIHSFDIPVLYGYNLVKQGPYGMSVFGGPKFRYIWESRNDIRFENFDENEIHEHLYPLNMNFVVGIGVNISRIFFDFRYEQGLFNISKSIVYNSNNLDATDTTNSIVFRRHESTLSFSFGFMF